MSSEHKYIILYSYTGTFLMRITAFIALLMFVLFFISTKLFKGVTLSIYVSIFTE